eukprot:Opistho-2@86730
MRPCEWSARVVFFSAIAVALLGSLVQSATEIGYQVHSYNDLREWPQTLRKGATWLKIDPHFMPTEFCASQPNVKDPSRGCFLLNHDDPVAERKSYFALDDVLDFATSPENVNIFSGPETIFIALFFKYDNPCDGSPASANWTALVDTFFDSANSAIAAHGLNVEFILDGAATPTQKCLANRWRPWNATWIVMRDPWDAATSDDPTLGYDRFTINNMPEGKPSYLLVSVMRAIHYGKFAGRSMPYLLWEPSDQKSILEIASTYRNGPRHTPGFRFAINIDPVQFLIYSARASGNAWNVELPTVDASSLGGFTTTSGIAFGDPLVVSLNYGTDHESDLHTSLIIVVERATTEAAVVAGESTTVAEVRAYGVNAVGTIVVPLRDPVGVLAGGDSPFGLLGSAVVSASIVHTAHSSSAPVLLIADNAGSYVALSLAERPIPSLEVVARGSLPASTSDSQIAYHSIAASPQRDKTMAVDVISTSECGALLRSFVSANDPAPLSNAVVVKNGTVCVSSSPVKSASVALVRDEETATCDGGHVVIATFARSNAEVVMATVLCVTEATGFHVISPASPLTVGTEAHVAVAAIPAVGIIFAVTTKDGFPFNTVKHNTQNKPALCDLEPTSTPNVLTYTVGSVRGLIAQLASGSVASACSRHVAHGMYDMGSSAPVVSLAPADNEDGDSRTRAVTLVAVHTGIHADTKDSAGCGLPVAYSGTIMDGWDVDLTLWA